MGIGEELFNSAKHKGKTIVKQVIKKIAMMIFTNPITYIVLGFFLLIIIIAGVMMDDDSDSGSSGSGGYTNVGDSNFRGQSIVKSASGLHDYIRTNKYAYSCEHNVNGGYVNTCECNGTSHFGKNTFDEYDKIKCIDCSAYVSWVLNQALGEATFASRCTSAWFADSNNWTSKGWEKININDIQAGDILWKSGHVGIYIGNGRTLEAGSTNSIRSEYSYGSLQSVINNYEFGIRIK